ncbi:hypothetical protein L596_008053 [Steinernema carpocapsae]|uniref:HTH La-type RNA-binding domain-containing protein n=1 Tax=Steinernema carpocapsae TaxID=34508 RepID=A0A4U5PBA4_STECR|nr:hypothetical protein L596_008053 [Steinernema carpocapsae]
MPLGISSATPVQSKTKRTALDHENRPRTRRNLLKKVAKKWQNHSEPAPSGSGGFLPRSDLCSTRLPAHVIRRSFRARFICIRLALRQRQKKRARKGYSWREPSSAHPSSASLAHIVPFAATWTDVSSLAARSSSAFGPLARTPLAERPPRRRHSHDRLFGFGGFRLVRVFLRVCCLDPSCPRSARPFSDSSLVAAVQFSSRRSGSVYSIRPEILSIRYFSPERFDSLAFSADDDSPKPKPLPSSPELGLSPSKSSRPPASSPRLLQPPLSVAVLPRGTIASQSNVAVGNPMEDDSSGAFFVCSEPSPRVFVIQRLSRNDAVRYCGDSKDVKNAEAGEEKPKTPQLHAPTPMLPWWFTEDVQNQMRKFDPSKHATSLREADNLLLGAAVAACGAPTLSSSEQMRNQLRAQLEYYFSRENLITDRYLRCQMDADQYVPIKIIANFPKITQLTNDIALIVQVLRESSNVQVDESGEKVRAASRRCTILIREIPETEEEEVKAMLEGTASYQSLTYGFNNTWYVTFETEEATQRAFLHLQNLGKTFNDKPISARIKTGGCPNAPGDLRSHSATPTDVSRSIATLKTYATTPTEATKSTATTPDGERATSSPSVPTIQFDLGQVLMSMGFVAKSAYKPGAPVVHFTCNNVPEAPLVTTPGVTVNVAHSSAQHHNPAANGHRSPVRGHRSPRASPLFFGHSNQSNYHNPSHNNGSYLAASSASNGYYNNSNNHYRGGSQNASGYGNSKLSPQCAASSSQQYSGGRRSSNYEYGKFYRGKRAGPPTNGPAPSNSYLTPNGIQNGASHRYRNGSYSNGRGSRPRFPISPSRTYAERNSPRIESIPKKEIECVLEDLPLEKEKPVAVEKKILAETSFSTAPERMAPAPTTMASLVTAAAKKRTISACETNTNPRNEPSSLDTVAGTLAAALAPKPESLYSFEEGEFPSLPELEVQELKKEEEKPPPFSVIVAGRQKIEAKKAEEAAAAANRCSYAQTVGRKAALANAASAAVAASHS